MTVRDRLLPLAERVRGLPARFGVRPWEVTVQVRQWSGERIGLGTPTTLFTILHVDFGRSGPRVQTVTSHDVVASGGLYSSGDVKVGPITPDCYSTILLQEGGHLLSDIDPPRQTTAAEVLFKITGPGMDDGGTLHRRISATDLKLFRYELILRAIKAKSVE